MIDKKAKTDHYKGEATITLYVWNQDDYGHVVPTPTPNP